MSRFGGLKLSTSGLAGNSPSLQGLAIITENEKLASPLTSPENIPDISIDESFLTSNNQALSRRKRAATAPEISNVQKSAVVPPDSLCGARVAVYRHTSTGRSKGRSIATISGVFRIGHRHFALTVAHVFFDDVGSTGSWTDSDLCVTNNSINGISQEVPPPKISETYEIIIESYWPNSADPEAHTKPTNISLGLVAPSVLHRRKGPEAVALPEVIWDDELDWALVELSEPVFRQVNRLQLSSNFSLDLRPPLFDQKPPTGDVIVAAGVSGAVSGVGLNSTDGIRLPWARFETPTWTIESEIVAGDYGAMVVCPMSGGIYGMVVAHNSETMITHIVPAPAIFKSILSRYSEQALTLNSMFPSANRGFSATTPSERSAYEDYLRTPVVRSAGTDIMNIFTSSLQNFAMQSIDGRRFVRRSALIRWLQTPRRDGIPHIDFMLDDAYPRNSILPITGDQISHGDETCLVIFSILFELGRAALTHLFMRQGLTDSRLPFDISLLNDAVGRMGLDDSDVIAQDFFESQWAYCPMSFDLEMERDIPIHLIIPIHQKQQINSKGGTATLWQITVLEEFVGKRLQAVSTKARFNDSADKLGYRYYFAVKSFAKHQAAFFESEVTAFKAFRTIPSMIGYLGNYHYTAIRPKRRASSLSVSEEKRQDLGPVETNNILLEYGDFDLDEYFAATQPPVLPVQVTQFWEDIAGIADAISEIHKFSASRAGVKQEYSGWHADIKPDNILNVKGAFKLADPGFARFERSEKKVTRLVGGTKTYGSPEAHSTLRMQDRPVSQAIDIWSLGCVLSIAATWVILGWSGVTQFQQLRVEALKGIGGQTPNLNQTRRRSQSTGPTSALSVNGGRGLLLPESDCFHDGEKVLEEVCLWHKFLRSVVRQSDQVSVQMLNLVEEKMLATNPDHRIKATELYRQMRLIVHSSETSNHDVISDIVSRVLLQSNDRATTEAPRPSAMTLSTGRTELSPISPIFRSSNRSLHPPSPQASSSPQPPQQPLSSKMTLATTSTASEGGSSEANPTETRTMPFRSIALNEIAGRSFSSSIDIPAEQSRPSLEAEEGLKPARRMSVSQARTEVGKKKKVFSRRKKDPFLTKHLENRDIEFLVDNGDTMAKHWSEVRELVEILCSMVSDVDKDGFDLAFTSGPVKLRQKSNSRAIKSTMDNDLARPESGVHTDMSTAIDRILSQYCARIKSRSYKSPSKNYTLIVLTDGVWRGISEPHAVEDTIVRWMNEIARHEDPRRRNSRAVTIQFIQFGDDEEATSRLQMLDRGLVDFEIPDIIDTEPSDGNVLKMLLGSVDASFDYADSGI